jgi:hypothetical protein
MSRYWWGVYSHTGREYTNFGVAICRNGLDPWCRRELKEWVNPDAARNHQVRALPEQRELREKALTPETESSHGDRRRKTIVLFRDSRGFVWNGQHASRPAVALLSKRPDSMGLITVMSP